ncbi:MAG: SpoVA/SpoVAEb family sporulation membrane protein [Lachnospiraceae bacterium]|nr:SpoVA/SpoVAEb family sporulation membrane protein [uncultured Acetatifactor sp.]MCI9572740.1 SpoVA/SpoVAEb family sporulation membrane protein [Lachnospiraceae bacterium]
MEEKATGNEKKQQQKEYEQYVKAVTPTHNLWQQMLHAFITGGIICCIGQFILNYAEDLGLDKQSAGSWCSLLLVLLSVLLTGFGLFQKIAKWGGAGALVPITGFANSVAAPAIEYKAEGQVFGIGCKIFTIAGPVILYGIFTSWVLGVIYWIGKMMGIA